MKKIAIAVVISALVASLLIYLNNEGKFPKSPHAKIPLLGSDGKPVLDASGNPVYK
jgi:hypothetical protein